jgi:hypothetical protein
VHDVWVFDTRGDLMVEVLVTTDWVGHYAGGYSRSEEIGRYLPGEFNAGWIDDVGFLEGANGKGARKSAEEG